MNALLRSAEAEAPAFPSPDATGWVPTWTRTGLIFDEKTLSKSAWLVPTGLTPRFTQKTITYRMKEFEKAVSVLKDAAGEQVIEEVAVFSGSTIYFHDFKQFQSKEHYRVERKTPEKVTIGTYEIATEHKKKSQTELEGSKDFITGPVIEKFIQLHWDLIVEKGMTVGCRMGVLEREDTIGFKFFRDGEIELQGKKLIRLVFKPSSIVIAALVPNLQLYFDPATKRMVRYSGRTPLLLREGEKLRPFNGEIAYIDEDQI